MKNDKKINVLKQNKIKISLKEKFENYKGKNPIKFIWDKPKGKEMW